MIAINKKGQITIFVIIAIVLVVGIITIFIFRDSLFSKQSNNEFSEIYGFFDDCIEINTANALRTAGLQGGYIDTSQLVFEPGSKFAPSSSQLDFLGNPVPYWYYVSGNNIIREQVPSKNEIQNQIGEFINQELRNCDFSSFIEQGYVINNSIPESKLRILNDRVEVSVEMDLFVSKGELSGVKREHNVFVDSKFGNFYDLALKIYNDEKKQSFLENFSVDVLRLYAPVTGTELSCRPLIWNPASVTDEIKNGLSANVAALKVNGDYYTLRNNQNKYFVLDNINVEAGTAVNFMYNPSWPTRVEVWPVDGNLMIAKPVGLESGLGILGFCYVPYHFVYDVYYPVLIQIYDGNEMFQFPVTIVIDKSVPRDAISVEGEGSISQEGTIDQLCDFKNTNIDVYTYDSNLAPVESSIKFTCIEAECNIGMTSIQGNDAVLSGNFPQCVNGKITAEAEGFVPSEYTISTNQGGTANILLDRLYDKQVKLFIDGREINQDYNGLILVNFGSEKNSQSLVYSDSNIIRLSEEYYNISVQVFSSSSLVIPQSNTRQCVDVPAPGIFGFFGRTNQECFNIDIPSQKLDSALSAGGKVSEYILESDLRSSNFVEIRVRSLPNPSTLDQLQQNYELYEASNAEVIFR
ncbi:MAG TPA: hypothetical protein VI815_02165 [Candidatus Nanoarchaeia archaeon]|nr:hypothetical protein [Candidatus Nanoarchaeia archaeon]